MKSSPFLVVAAVLVLVPRGGAGVFDQSFVSGTDIPDSSSTGLLDLRNISLAEPYIQSITVTLGIEPTPGQSAFLGDLYAYLEHDGVISVLVNRPGRRADETAGYDDNQSMTVTFATGAPDFHNYRPVATTPLAGPITGTFGPDARATDPRFVLSTEAQTLPLSGFVGANGSGDWRLFVADLSGGGEHRLVSWGLQLQTSAIPEPGVWAASGALAVWAGWRLFRRSR